MTKIIAFVEDEFEVKTILERNILPDLWIALEPLGIQLLENEKLPFRLIEDYAKDQKEIFDNTYWNSKKIIDLLIDKTDNWVRKEYSEFSRYNIDLLKYFIFYLNILFDGIIYRLFLLKKVLEKENPAAIYFFKKKVKENFSTQFPWHYEESVWCYCMERIKTDCENDFSFSLNIIEYDSDYSPEELITQKYLNLYSFSPYLFNFLKILKKRGFIESLNFIKNSKIGVLNLDYQWLDSEPIFKETGYNCFDIRASALLKLKYPDNKKKIIDAIGLDQFLIYDDINLLPMVADKLNFIISIGIKNFINNYKKILRLIKSNNIKAICFSMITDARVWLIPQAAKNLGIPIFVWGHGASGQAEFSKQKDFELLICDYYLTQGQGSQKKYLSYSNYDSTPIPVGFSTLDSLKLNSTETNNEVRFSFLYVTTFLYRKRLYFSFYPIFSDNEFYNTQRAIINYLGNLKGNSLIKLYPSYIGNRKFIRDNSNLMVKKSNLHFRVDDKFKDLITLADAIIIDCPTTVLLEALTTEKALFILTKHLKLTDHADNLLQRRAIVSKELDNLFYNLEEYVKCRTYKADLKNTDYLKEYGTYLNDGKSAERAVKEIISRI